MTLPSSPDDRPAASPPASGGGGLSDISGDPTSASALARLTRAAGALEKDTVAPRLQRALAALEAGDLALAERTAMDVVQTDADQSLAWRIVGSTREKTGDFTTALKCYEQVVRIGTDLEGIEADLGRVAYHTGLFDDAVELFRAHLVKQPQDIETANNLASALRDQMNYDAAIELLSGILKQTPDAALLWNTLATLMVARFDADRALTFFDEAIRLQPDFAKAIYNRANLLTLMGRMEEAIADLRRAEALPGAPPERAMMRLALAQALLAGGHIAEGWEAYEARRDPHFPKAPIYLTERPLWSPGDPLAGRQVLLFGEQGLGDEVLFASLIPDLQAAIGSAGRLFIAVEPRLVPLFQRSFPEAVVGGHATGLHGHSVVRAAPFAEAFSGEIDCWMPMAAPLRQFRRTLESFAGARGFLSPDPDRVAHWRRVLDDLGPGPKIGVLWKSMVIDPSRSRHFSPFEQWASVLGLEGPVFVNIQYGDSAAEQAEATRLCIRLWTPPGIDLKNDLDDLAALTTALDLVVGPANATSNIAAACGAPVTLVSLRGAWPQLGTQRWPFYADMQVIEAEGLGQWDGAMQALSRHIVRRFGLPHPGASS